MTAASRLQLLEIGSELWRSVSREPRCLCYGAAAGRRPVIIDQCMRSIELHAAAAAVNFGSGRRASWLLMLAAIETEKVRAGNP